MRRLKLVLEYKDYPLWIYDEKGGLIDVDYPEDIEQNKKIIGKLDEIQEEYNSLFLDDGKEFKYIGFKNKEDEILFLEKLKFIYDSLLVIVNGKYKLECSNKIQRDLSEVKI